MGDKMFKFCIVFIICLTIFGVSISNVTYNEDVRCVKNRIESVGGKMKDVQVKINDSTTIYTAKYIDQNGDIKFAKYIKESPTDKYFMFID